MFVSRLENGTISQNIISDIEYDLSCDVLCVGAGGAGIYAADAAARQGAKVILVENDISIGGMSVQGNVRKYYYGFEGGSFEQDDAWCNQADCFVINASQGEKKRVCLLRRLTKSGVTLLCQHTPTGIVFNEKKVVGLCVYNGEKEVFIQSKIVIDATSDGHLIHMCKVNKRYGRDLDGKSAPFSVVPTYMKDGKFHGAIQDAGRINQYDSRDFSAKVILAHKNLAKEIDKGEFLDVASHTGLREGLSFEGEDTLHYSDIIYGRYSKKVLFWAYSDLDRHGCDRALDEELFQNWWVISNLATVTFRIPIPLGCVVPKGIMGLVSAGRCFSADTYTQSAVRMTRDMYRMGECVGTAAALAAKSDVHFLDIDYETYIKEVNENGCFAGDEDKTIGFDYPKKDKPYTPVEFDVEKNFHLLKTEAPGVAIWSCFVCEDKESLAERLFSEMNTTNDLAYQYNLAIALGIIEDKRALPTLREIVKKRDCFYFKDCRRSNQFRSAIAICLLGRIGEKEDISLLEPIVFDECEYSNEIYHTLSPARLYYNSSDRNFLYFTMLTHAAAALVKIHKRCGIPALSLGRRFEQLLAEGKVVERIVPNRELHKAPYVETVEFLSYISSVCMSDDTGKA